MSSAPASSASVTAAATTTTTTTTRDSSQKSGRPTIGGHGGKTQATKPIPIPRSETCTSYRGSLSPPSLSGLAVVQTPCGGWIVLKDAGQDRTEDGTDDDGLWDLLSVDEQGVALAGAEVELMRLDLMEDMGEGW